MPLHLTGFLGCFKRCCSILATLPHARTRKQNLTTCYNKPISLSPRTDKLLVASDDPRMFLAAHVYGPPASL